MEEIKDFKEALGGRSHVEKEVIHVVVLGSPASMKRELIWSYVSGGDYSIEVPADWRSGSNVHVCNQECWNGERLILESVSRGGKRKPGNRCKKTGMDEQETRGYEQGNKRV
jgi:hypothetical protein